MTNRKFPDPSVPPDILWNFLHPRWEVTVCELIRIHLTVYESKKQFVCGNHRLSNKYL